MAALDLGELGTEAPFEPSPLPRTPISKKPRSRKRYGGLQAGPLSSPIALNRSDLTPPKPTRPRAVSIETARAGRKSPEIDKRRLTLGGPLPLRAAPTTDTRPAPRPRRRPHTDPETPRVKIATPRKSTPLRSASAPSLFKSEVQTCDRIVQLLKNGPKNLSRDGTYNYLVVLKKTGTDEEDFLKIGISKTVNVRMRNIKYSCKFNTIEELPGSVSYTGELAAIAESLMLAELDGLKCVTTCCGKKHRDRYKMADKKIVSEVFHHWLDFCKSAPWDDKGRLKPCWLKRLDQHMQRFDTRGPESQRDRLRLHWKTFTDISTWQKIVYNFRTVVRVKKLLSWKGTAILEAIVICCFTYRSSIIFLWLCLWLCILCLDPYGETLDYDELWTISHIDQDFEHRSLLRHDGADGEKSEAGGASTDDDSSEGHIEDGATSHEETIQDETALYKIIPADESDGDSDLIMTNQDDVDYHDDQISDFDSDEMDSTVSASTSQREPRNVKGAEDNPILVLSDSEDDKPLELPDSLPRRLPEGLSIPTYRLDISSPSMAEYVAWFNKE